MRSYPLIAHWLEGEPIEDSVQTMGAIEDRYRHFCPDGVPAAPGVLPLGDAFACTNPSVGRGISIGLMHAVALRDLLRDADLADAHALSLAWDASTEATVGPYVRDTLFFDGHRLAEIDAQIDGVPYEPDDTAWRDQQLLFGHSGKDPELLRGVIEIMSLLDRAPDVLARPAVAGRLADVGRGAAAGAAPGHHSSRPRVAPGGWLMRVETNGVELEVEVRGDGPPVLLLHGWPDDHHLWDVQVEALVAAGFRTIAPDLRGFGESSKPDGVASYTSPLLVGDVIGLLDALGVARAHVVGHDWGAAISWILAVVVPDRVDHLVAMSVGHLASFADADMEQRERSWYMLLFQFEDVAEQWLSEHDWANFRVWSQHPTPDVAIKSLARPGALTATLNLYRANAVPRRLVEAAPPLPAVAAPTMGIWSTGDRHLLEAQMKGSAAHVSNTFRYERIEDAGHWMTLDVPDRINDLLLDFLPSASSRLPEAPGRLIPRYQDRPATRRRELVCCSARSAQTASVAMARPVCDDEGLDVVDVRCHRRDRRHRPSTTTVASIASDRRAAPSSTPRALGPARRRCRRR